MDRSNTSVISSKYEQMMTEMVDHNFQVIRFSSYRTASKLRFIQHKTNFHLIDLWNSIEAIRDSGLNNIQDISSQISVQRLETLVTSVFYSLSKRLPQSLSLNLDQSIELMLSWLLATYDPTGCGKVNVFGVKIAFAIMSFGKLIDKLRYIFSLISDASRGLLIESYFNAFLRESMALTASVAETTTFQYDDSLSSSIFDFSQAIDLHLFMSVFITTNSPPLCISWIVILHRMAEVEQVVHPIACNACNRQPFNGFRYKCQKCFNYNLCQDCFWRGRHSGSHNADTHACKEYGYWKSPTKQIGHSLRKSFRCIPSNRTQLQYIDEPPKDKRFNLSHIVPPSPVPTIHHMNSLNHMRSTSSDLESLYGSFKYRSPSSIHTTATNEHKTDDEEHRLIARYAAALANYTKGSVLTNSTSQVVNDISNQQRVIKQLEEKNREIMKEIETLRLEKQENEMKDSRIKSSSHYANVSQTQLDPILLTELSALRQRKEELESHLSALQDSRRQLMVQLEGLMKLLKNHGNLLSIPNSAPSSASSTLNRKYVNSLTSTVSESMLSDISNATVSTVNRDLLVAADSVTNAMSSLVKELNSDDEEDLVQQIKHKVLINEIIDNTNRQNINLDKDIEIEEQKLKSKALAASVAFS
ncbi:dystrobrevin beta-like [Oppia nitens]|uniref:dystrobrevin beta-like n=1 Tax=Oppia nitens TaxID=1686743 RepID=UPI0023DC24BB|nr:dystrobrevin beta-like [Oppia nitens]